MIYRVPQLLYSMLINVQKQHASNKVFPHGSTDNGQFTVVNPGTERIWDVPDREGGVDTIHDAGWLKFRKKTLCPALNRFSQMKYVQLGIQVVLFRTDWIRALPPEST